MRGGRPGVTRGKAAAVVVVAAAAARGRKTKVLLWLKFSGLLVAGLAHAHGVVPAPRRDGPALGRALVAHALAAGAAVVLGQLGGEVALAAVARQDVLVRHPVGRTGRVLHQACRDTPVSCADSTTGSSYANL